MLAFADIEIKNSAMDNGFENLGVYIMYNKIMLESKLI